MKLSMILLTVALSSHAFASDEVRNETHTRSLGKQITGVSACSEPVLSTYEFQDAIVNQDGNISRTKNGQIRYQKMVKLTATSRMQYTACEVNEKYMVAVTGSFWNSSSSEIPGQSEKFGQAYSDVLSFDESQDFNLSKLGQAAGYDGYFNDGGLAGMVSALGNGLAAKAKARCEAKVAQMRSAAVSQSQTLCK